MKRLDCSHRSKRRRYSETLSNRRLSRPPNQATHRYHNQETAPQWRRLTPRQREVLQLVAEGRSNKEIGVLLAISIKGVEYHKSAIERKLRTNKPAELTRYAVSAGLVTRGLT